MNEIRTSQTHHLYIDAIAVPRTFGQLGMTICPGKKGPSIYGFTWERSTKHDVREIHAWGATTVVTLMEEN